MPKNSSIPRIAILVDSATGWGRRLIQGVLEHTKRAATPWDLLIEPHGPDESLSLARFKELDGVIARIATKELSEEIAQRQLPAVNVSRIQLPGRSFQRISNDYDSSAKLAVEHFRNRSFQNFAYVGPIQLPHVQEHCNAFARELKAYGKVPHVHSFGSDSSSLPSLDGNSALRDWLTELPKPIAIYTWAFQIGRDLINLCRRSRIQVPHEAAILGGDYDDLLCEACYPPLSGVLVPARQIGIEAAARLNAMMMKKRIPPAPDLLLEAEGIAAHLSTDTLAVDNPQLRDAIRYLRKHACAGIQVDDILQAVPMGRRSLERQFRQYLDSTPAKELRRVRVQRARELLTSTDLSLEQIAEACGFPNYNYLSAVFKQETGIAPGAYRKRAAGL